MGKNAQIHLYLETSIYEAILRESKQRNISISELCRQKLRESSQLTRIELLLENLLKGERDFGRRSPKSRVN